MNMNPERASILQQDLHQRSLTAEEQQRELELERMLTKLEEHRITPDKELHKMEFLFRLFHKPCFPRGELVAFSGKAKSGKTFASSILMALCFRSQVLSVERIEQKRLHVLWYDTEQSEESTQDILRNRIIPMVLGHTSQKELTASESATVKSMMELFDIFNVRAEGYDKRLLMLEVAVRHYQPDLVILDGIRDLVADINDGVVAQDCIERLMQLASEVRCCIVCVLHQNKSTEDRNLRGWIGTELKNKAFEVYECSKSSERIFAIGQTDTRKYDILDTLKFAVNEGGIPYLCTEEQLKEALFQAQRKMADERQRQGGSPSLLPFNPKYVLGKDNHKTVFDLPKLFSACMEPGKTYYETELQVKVGTESNIATDKVFREQLSKALSQGVIMQSKSALNGKTIYMLSQAQLPFKAPEDEDEVTIY